LGIGPASSVDATRLAWLVVVSMRIDGILLGVVEAGVVIERGRLGIREAVSSENGALVGEDRETTSRHRFSMAEDRMKS